MALKLSLTSRDWPLSEPFVIARDSWTKQPVICVQLEDGAGHIGRGEACGIDYRGETPTSMQDEIESVRNVIEGGVTRQQLVSLLGPAGARCALDAALWDLEAQRDQRDLIAVDSFPLKTAYTIGIRSIEAYEQSARDRADYPLLKVKLGKGNPMAAICAVRTGAPNAALIVDPNQAWSCEELKAYAPDLADKGVVLIEQPIAIGAEPGLDGWRSPVPLAADELIDCPEDLEKADGRYDIINIKLDKTEGLTAALELADIAQSRGFGLMIGCMAGSSLAMAPGLVLAPRCDFIDLDGPLLQSADVEYGLTYDNGWIRAPSRHLWGLVR